MVGDDKVKRNGRHDCYCLAGERQGRGVLGWSCDKDHSRYAGQKVRQRIMGQLSKSMARMVCNPALKRKAILSHTTTWMKREAIILSEVSQTQRTNTV